MPKKTVKTTPTLPEVKIEKKEKTKKTVLEPEFSEAVVQVDRIARVMAGGRRMRFRAAIAVGNNAGKVGIGVAKAVDVASAVKKAKKIALKNIITVPIINDTIPYKIEQDFGAAKILLKPASKGTGIIAGGPVRIICGLAGIKNILTKILGSQNKINNLKAIMLAFKNLKMLSEKIKK